MFNTIKTYHRLVDLAKDKVAEAQAEVAMAERHIAALAPALDDAERAAYALFLADREKLANAAAKV